MKFCMPHWNALRDAIAARGLAHLGARTGQEAAARVVAEVKGQATDRTYDPLMDAHNMIVAHVTEQGGLYLFTGDYCPVCEAIKGHAKTMTPAEVEDHYINGPADAVLAYCRQQKLVLEQ
jgi:hypothetical protein